MEEGNRVGGLVRVCFDGEEVVGYLDGWLVGTEDGLDVDGFDDGWALGTEVG